jgi:peroxiredoxin/predicted 2-oxoglutarate/Fe(II)-dependent dioxygenase YbiX
MVASPLPFVLEVGERAPNFALPDVAGTLNDLTVYSRGNPYLLVICEAGPEAHLKAFAASANEIKATGADTFIITRKPPQENQRLAEMLVLPFGVLSDKGGQVCAGYGNRGNNDIADVTTVLLDRNLRITHIDRDGSGADQCTRVLARLREFPTLGTASAIHRTAPVLMIPNVLDAAECAQLIGLYDSDNFESTAYDPRADQGGKVDRNTKIRRDHFIKDPALGKRISDVVTRRIIPEVERAYYYSPNRAEDFRISCYDGRDEGFFAPHRDNVARGLSYRRFALSLLLNDASDYEGGGMRYMEYGPDIYYPGAGTALLFSCALLHEVMPVTEGRRYVLISFLYDEASMAATRRANQG